MILLRPYRYVYCYNVAHLACYQEIDHGHMLMIRSIVLRGCRRLIERSLLVITRRGVRLGTRPRISNDGQMKRKVKWRTKKSQADSECSVGSMALKMILFHHHNLGKVSRRLDGSRSRILTLQAASEDGRNYIERLFSLQLSQKCRSSKTQKK